MATIKRACSFKATIRMPEAPGNYSAILVTFAQNRAALINLAAADLTVDGQFVIARLDQDQTKLFEAGVPAYMQIRAYKSQYEAPGSRLWPLEIQPALNDEVLP